MMPTTPSRPGPLAAVTECGGSPGEDRRVEAMARIVLRPIGSPLPVGFIALGGASVALTGLQLGWVPLGESRQVAIVVLAFAVPLQLLASVFGYLARDSVGGNGLAVLGGSWLVAGLLVVNSPPGARSPTLGLLPFFSAPIPGRQRHRRRHQHSNRRSPTADTVADQKRRRSVVSRWDRLG